MRIITCINRGSMIQMLAEEDGSLVSIPWDWRMFQGFVDSLLAENPNLTTLSGLEIEYDGENGLVSVKKLKWEGL